MAGPPIDEWIPRIEGSEGVWPEIPNYGELGFSILFDSIDFGLFGL